MKTKIKKHTISLHGIYLACTHCQAHLNFRDGQLLLQGGVVIKPGTASGEYIITAHRVDCSKIED